MKSLLARRPSPALVISLIALFLSLSGVSYGVATGFIDSREIKNNEVRSLDIRNNEIRTRDIRNNEVRGIDLRNSTIQSRDIGLNQVTGLDVREDSLQKVPSAALADTATNATTAGSAGSARRRLAGASFGRSRTPVEQGSALVEVSRCGGLILRLAASALQILEVRGEHDGAPIRGHDQRLPMSPVTSDLDSDRATTPGRGPRRSRACADRLRGRSTGAAWSQCRRSPARRRTACRAPRTTAASSASPRRGSCPARLLAAGPARRVMPGARVACHFRCYVVVRPVGSAPRARLG